MVNNAPHDTVLKRYRVAAGSARTIYDYLLMHDSSILYDYRLPRDPRYSTITVTSTIPTPPRFLRLHNSAIDIATGIAPTHNDSARDIATGIAAHPHESSLVVPR